MTKPDIEQIKEDDLAALAVIAAETELFPPELLPDLAAPALEGHSDTIWLTAHLGGQPVGFCFAETEQLADRVWNMRALAVSPAVQGRGVGTALVAALEYLLRQDAQRMVLVDTSGSDAFAQTRKFYEQSTYAIEARIRDYWTEGDDKVIYRKTL